jgi:hypothetical protein
MQQGMSGAREAFRGQQYHEGASRRAKITTSSIVGVLKQFFKDRKTVFVAGPQQQVPD